MKICIVSCSSRNKEETMILRTLSMAILATGLAGSALTQQNDVAAEQEMREKIEEIPSQWQDAFNKGDSQVAATFFTPNAISINSAQGLVSGIQGYEKLVQSQAKMGT